MLHLKALASLEIFIDISYTLDSASYPAGGRKLKPVRGRNYVIFMCSRHIGRSRERDNLYIEVHIL